MIRTVSLCIREYLQFGGRVGVKVQSSLHYVSYESLVYLRKTCYTGILLIAEKAISL